MLELVILQNAYKLEKAAFPTIPFKLKVVGLITVIVLVPFAFVLPHTPCIVIELPVDKP
jgi:hypothetical protein